MLYYIIHADVTSKTYDFCDLKTCDNYSRSFSAPKIYNNQLIGHAQGQHQAKNTNISAFDNGHIAAFHWTRELVNS